MSAPSRPALSPLARAPLACAMAILALLLALPALAQDGGPSKYWFSVDEINAGLGEPPGSLDRETPQATLESFLFATDSKDYETAAHLLDLREIPEGLRAEVAPELARRLRAVLNRRVWVDWEMLTDRPDGLTTSGGSDNPQAGEPRRSLRMAYVDLGDRSVPIRMNRIKPENGDAAWLWSRQTVENIDAMYRLHGPTAFEQAMPDNLRQDVFLGLQWWELIALPILVLGAFFAALAIYKLFGAIYQRTGGWVRAVAGAVQLPFAIATGALLVDLALEQVISFNGAVMLFLDPIVYGFLILAGAILLVRVIDALLSLAIDRNAKDIDAPEADEQRDFYTNVSGARRLITVVVLLFGVGFVLSQTNLLANLGFAALGGASVLTLILAFAGRAALSNIMSSLQIAFSKPARIGDTLMFQGEWVTVKRIHFTYVELEVWDGRLLIVPVNEFVSEPFENLTKHDAELVRTVFLTLDHRADLDALRETLKEFVDGDDRVVDSDSAQIIAYSHDRDGVKVRAQINTVDPSTGWTVALELREALLKRARELEAQTGEPVLPVERELKVGSRRDGLANVPWDREAAE